MESLFYLSFALVDGIGPKRFESLLKKLGTAEKAWESSINELKNTGLGPKTIAVLGSFRNTFSAKEYVQKLKKNNIWFVAQNEKEYPNGLKKLPNPPIVLFGRGDKSCLNISKSIGVVGTRKVTSYGREVTESLVADLVSYGFTIISGMALGVDAIAHQSCLESGGKTIAVLGNGVDLPFPRENSNLYTKIIESGGTVISEYPPGVNPTKGSFPARNRIIAALSLGILITEAAEDSGSLITAEWGFSLGKKVFSVPGPINSSMSRGSLKLLKQGAVLVQNTQDILNEFGIQSSRLRSKNKKDYGGLNKEELRIVRLLEKEPLGQDLLAKKLKIPVRKLSIILSGLEMQGVIKGSSGAIQLV